MRQRLLLATSLLVFSFGLLPAQEPAAEGPALTVYPSFHLKFAKGNKNFLLGSFVIVNVSGNEMRNLTLTQKLPEQFTFSQAPPEVHEYFVRPDGFTESIEGSTYKMTVPVLHKRELTTGFVVLNYRGRPDEAEIAPAEIEYSVRGEARTEKGPPVRLELRKYSKYSGSLSDFLKRFAGMQVQFPEGGAGWGFSGLASRVHAKTPIGIVEIEGDATEGRFSLLSGAPGELREMLLSWKPAGKAKPAETPEQVRKLIGDQTFAAADFTFDSEKAPLEKRRLARGEAWVLESRWKDRVERRLGEGPMRWYVYSDPQKGAQYIIMFRAQGRGAGPGKADTPNPEKEAALAGELDGVMKSFRPI